TKKLSIRIIETVAATVPLDTSEDISAKRYSTEKLTPSPRLIQVVPIIRQWTKYSGINKPNINKPAPNSINGRPNNTVLPSGILSIIFSRIRLPAIRPPKTGNCARPYCTLLNPNCSTRITGDNAIHNIKGRL